MGRQRDQGRRAGDGGPSRANRPARGPRGLDLEDVRQMLRLCRALHEAGADPAGRKRLLLEGVCRLLGAERAACVVTHMDPTTGRPTVVSSVATGPARSDAGGAERQAAPETQAAGRDVAGTPEDSEHRIDSLLPLRGLRVVARLAVGGRPGGAGRPFTPRHRAILELLHAESAWVYAPDLLLLTPEALTLSPRQRQVLQHLLAGENEQQVAAALRQSPNTVHHHVKALYRHFGVRSRGELLARWVQPDAAGPSV